MAARKGSYDFLSNGQKHFLIKLISIFLSDKINLIEYDSMKKNLIETRRGRE